MTITFRCGHCGKKVEAPDAAGGKRGKCPYCKQSNYIPAPVSEDDIIPLAPEDDEAGAEDEAVRRQEQALIAELGARDQPQVPLEDRQDITAEDLQHYVVNYCLDMSTSKLERARTHLAELKKVRPLARQAVDAFLKGDVLEPALDTIPPKLLQGFLSNLRNELN